MRVIAIPNRDFPPARTHCGGARADCRPTIDPGCELAGRTCGAPEVVGVSLYADRQLARDPTSSTQALWPPRPIAFESATSTSASRASFGT